MSLWLATVALSWAIAHGGEARLLRFPAIHDNQLVFSYAGDLYTVPATGGIARRLTSDEQGYEMFARFSPNGKWLAFTAQYDGNTEVYLMPSQGGVPKRLTYTATVARDDVSDRMGPNNIVMTWRNNNSIVFRSRAHNWDPFKGQLDLAFVDGRMQQQLPLPSGSWCSYSPDGKRLAFNRVFREFRTWKRYRGGQADDLWIYNFATRHTERITHNPAQDIFPMWHGRRIYFVSDRDANMKMNLYVYDLDTKAIRELTHFTEYDVKFPSLGPRAIVFENGGWIYRFDLQTEQVRKVPIQIDEDLAIGRGGWRSVADDVQGYDVAPDGARAVLEARGDIFTVPAQHGPTRNLTQSPGVHERNPVWSPDGRWIAYISDRSGEDEVWLEAQDGSSAPRQLTTGGVTYKYRIVWSPDSKKLLWGDKENRLRYVDIDTREVTLVDQSKAWEIRQYTWSPDSQWIAYSRPEVRRFPNIYLYSLKTHRKVAVTDGWFDVGSPAFSADGKYLFFVSDRSFHPTFGTLEWNHVYTDMQRIYLLTLAQATPSPLAPKSDEVKLPIHPTTTDSPAKASEKGHSVQVKVDFAGIQDRIAVLPPPASRYRSLTSAGNRLYYQRKGKLCCFDLNKLKETVLGNAGGYRISANHKKMLVRQGNQFAIIDLPTSKLETQDKSLNLAELRVNLNRHAEWHQIFEECWRQMRDFLYDPNLGRVNWNAMRKRYGVLVPYVENRADLTYIIGEMIGELSMGHCYVGGGDYPKPKRIQMGLLGAQLERDASGYYRITRILKGENWSPKYRSPLTAIGVNVHVGDFILAVNGRSTLGMSNIYSSLVGEAGRQVKLTINDLPRRSGAHVETVVPTADEQPLYYLNWVLGNIATVNEATDGKVGYVHIPDMEVAGLNEFSQLYYAQLNKEALIVDERGNGGGNVSPQIIERLRREPAMWTVARNGEVDVNPGGQVLGPKVLLVDQYSASDGDIMAYRFRVHHLGPIIGKRTWGGVVGIRGSLPLLDGGYLYKPEFSRFGLDGKKWIIEGHGVTPDIVVNNDPAREYGGTDDQLNKAIAVIKKLLAEHPVHIPALPPYPDKRL